jgi:2-oxo-4-hydroxy-4-carboxy-5-ureidoimidazoline decarboxylase
VSERAGPNPTGDEADERTGDRARQGVGLPINQLSEDEARRELTAVCHAPRWVSKLLAGRPYASAAEVYRAAEALTDADVLDALAGHPRIGERRAEDAVSAGEQAAVAGADDEIRAALAEGNRRYEERFGQVYLVAATGRSAAELLADLRERLANDPAIERGVRRRELARINRIRLRRLVGE